MVSTRTYLRSWIAHRSIVSPCFIAGCWRVRAYGEGIPNQIKEQAQEFTSTVENARLKFVVGSSTFSTQRIYIGDGTCVLFFWLY